MKTNNCYNSENKKINILNSLQEVEYFLNNINCIFSTIKFAELLKKSK